MPTKVQFIHGLESGPHGAKARLLASTFDSKTPQMDTSNFEGCVAQHAKLIQTDKPDVVVGSSFGGAVLVALLQRGLWSGPSLLLAQAAIKRGLTTTLPREIPIWIVHGTGDTVVDVEDSRKLAADNSREEVKYIELDDDHSLHASTANGSLLDWVRSIATVQCGARNEA